MGVDTAAVEFDDGMLMVGPAAFAKARQDPAALARTFVAYARRFPGVLRAEPVSDLERGDTINDPITRRWVHMLPADAPVEATVTLEPGHVWGHAPYAMHGSPHDYDAHVPLIFYGSAFHPGRYDEFARVVDIAPTLARVLGVSPTEPLDGMVLQKALR